MYLHCKSWSKNQKGGLRGKDQKQQKFYGYMSSLAYKDAKKRAEGLAKHGFNLDEELSNEDILVAHNPQTKEVVHAITGSRFDDPKNKFRDIRSDLGILAGTDRLGKRTSEITDVVKKSQKKYGKDYNYTNTGHSLGSRVSMNVSKKLGIDHVGFNQGSSPLGAVSDRIARLFGRDKKATRINYTTGKDFISKSSQLLDDDVETNVVPLKKDVSTGLAGLHSIKHFTGQEGNGAPGSGVHKKNIKKNKWLVHVDQIKRKNKGMKYTEILKLASRSYVK
jgi:hypothetical protein